jgi:hypothetical protein
VYQKSKSKELKKLLYQREYTSMSTTMLDLGQGFQTDKTQIVIRGYKKT